MSEAQATAAMAADLTESSVSSPTDDSTAAAEILRRRMLDGPLLAETLRLAAPTILILMVQVLVGMLEIFFIGFLGTDALAGVTLVFPCLMLMQMVSNGGIGAGIASAVARAAGAGRREDMEALAGTALGLAILFGLAFTLAERLGGPALFRAMGGSDAALDSAFAYGGVTFGGAVLIWVVNLLTAALRGSGDALTPAVVTLLGLVVAVPLSPLLIFGLGPIPSLGVIGAGIGLIAYYGAALIFLLVHLRTNRCPLKVRLTRHSFSRRLLGDVLSVGGLASLGAATPNLSVAVVTAAIGTFGTDAIAGYGLASRLDYSVAPLLFGLGSGVMVMVGANTGAGQYARAHRITWLGALIGGGLYELLGLVLAMTPAAWFGLFSHDPTVTAIGATYFRTAGLLYGFAGASMLLSLAAQGGGRAFWPLMAGLAQLLVGSLGGIVAVRRFGAAPLTLFLIVALGSVIAFVVVAAAQIAVQRR
jgi:putative MATE family efflux protein